MAYTLCIMKINFLRKIDFVASLVRLGGIISLASIPFKALPTRIYSGLPFEPSRSAHVVAIIAGFALIYLASQLDRKKRNAWITTVSLLLLLIFVYGLRGHNHLHLAAFYSVLLFSLIIQKKQYVVRNDMTSQRHSLLLAAGMLLAVAGFVTITLTRLDQSEYGQNETTYQTLLVTARAVSGQPLPTDLRTTRKARDLIFSLQVVTVLSGTVALAGLFYPIRLRQSSSFSARARANRILQKYSTSSEEYLKIWPADKHYYFYNESFLAYGVSRGVALVLDGPAGDPEMWQSLRANFISECTANGWTLSIMHASKSEAAAWKLYGLHIMYICSEARVNIVDFCTDKARDKHFRYIKNKAERDGLRVTKLVKPLSSETLQQLKSVSDAWLASGRREYSFIMGFYDEQYLQRSDVYVVLKEDIIVAYTNLIPQYQLTHASVDHIRSMPDVSAATMHYLLMQVILTLGTDNQNIDNTTVQTINLGLAALSKIQDNVSKAYLPVMSIVKNLGGKYYSFAGLEQFKGKFSPQLEPTYLLYAIQPVRLPAIASAISVLTTYDKSMKPRRIASWLLGLSIVSGFSYASFPLALSLNPKKAIGSMVSILGQADQPYADVFNALDSIASITAITISAGLLYSLPAMPKLLKSASYALIISSIGNLLAAVFVLPAGFEIDDHLVPTVLLSPAVIAHGFTSILNSGGYVWAVACWAVWTYQRSGFGLRQTLAVLIFTLCSIGFLIGQLDLVAAPFIQRAFIASYALWLVCFVYDVLNIRNTNADIDVSSKD